MTALSERSGRKGRLDIVWISLPFTAGVAAGTSWAAAGGNPWQAAAAGMAAAAAMLAGLLARRRARRGDLAGRALLVGACLCCGWLCAATRAATGPPAAFAAGPAQRGAAALRRAVNAVPYRAPESGALVCALLTGDRSRLKRDTVRTFRDSGAAHLLALSGLHLGILYLILGHILEVLLGHRPAMRRLQGALLIAAAGGYALMTGASPSILRAWTFILLRETARLTGRSPRPAGLLCTALLLQLALRPEFIRSVGFQLSYLAMIGIYTVFPPLRRLWPDGLRFDPLRKIWELAALSISCQLFTGPLAWWRFGTFPVWFLLTNLLAMPLTSFILGLSLGLTVLYALGFRAGWLVSLDETAIRALLDALDILARM